MNLEQECFSTIPQDLWEEWTREACDPQFRHMNENELGPTILDVRAYLEVSAIIHLHILGLKPCSCCKGHGHSEMDDCLACNGSGVVRNKTDAELTTISTQGQASETKA